MPIGTGGVMLLAKTLPVTGIGNCRPLAILDVILSPDWEGRYYCMSAGWADGEEMASMRNESGAECSSCSRLPRSTCVASTTNRR